MSTTDLLTSTDGLAPTVVVELVPIPGEDGADGIGVPDPSSEPDDRWLKTQDGALVYTDPPEGGGGPGGPHADSHAEGGDDPVTLTTAQVTGLDDDLTTLARLDSLVIDPADPQYAGGADPTGTVSAVAAIQAALDAAGTNPRRRTVDLPAGSYLIDSPIYIPTGVHLRGDGVGGFSSLGGGQYGTELKQVGDTDVIRFEAALVGSRRFFGPGGVSSLSIVGDPTAGSGSAISFRDSSGNVVAAQDTVIIDNVFVRAMPEHGIELPNAGLPLHIRDCNFLWNGGYGIRITSAANLLQAIHLDSISGDGNLGSEHAYGGALVYVEGADERGSILLENIKSEKRVNSDLGGNGQEHAVILVDCSGTPVHIAGLTHISSIPDGSDFEAPGAAVRIIGPDIPALSWNGAAVRVRATDTGQADAVLVRDSENTLDVPRTQTSGRYGGVPGIAAVRDPSTEVHRHTVGAQSWQSGAGAENPGFEIAGLTPTLALHETDGGTDEKTWLLRGSAESVMLSTQSDDGSTRQAGYEAQRSGADIHRHIWSTSGTERARIDGSGLVVAAGSRIYPAGSAGPSWDSGAGSPEGVVTAVVGSLWTRNDGGTDTTLYIKETGTGNTGWVTVASIAAHLADTDDAHDASAISFSPTGLIAATTVQAALAELDSEKARVQTVLAETALTGGNCSVFTNAVHSAGTTTLTNGEATKAYAAPQGWYYAATISSLPPVGQVLTLEGGTNYFGAYPRVAITNTGACTVTDPSSATWDTFPTAAVNDKVVIVGGQGFVLIALMTATTLKDFMLFPAEFCQPTFLSSLGILLGARGYGAVKNVVRETW